MNTFLSPGTFLILATVLAVIAATGEMVGGDRMASVHSRYELASRLLRLQWYPAVALWGASAACCGYQASGHTTVVMLVGLLFIYLRGGRAVFTRPSLQVFRRLVLPTLVTCITVAYAAASGFPFNHHGFVAFEVLTGLFGAGVVRESAAYREPDLEMRTSLFG
ncbi:MULTISPECIES: hypothetical protein [unclassified Variovorax]|uniref:hypothetical protein n=1 Tax=unclassified Variovorax TaxID=663243 RepID=UPI0008387384|nr:MULTISPECIES: hypothetical protein [unclassified Variovorax]PNG49933.1 hypothetical protein CHC06_05514 [Variovorax sp. B2]PNG50805.1 hypothetical protein CHC07_05419 [Variovorax sp. B4]VTV18026.1 hypothetical protein WDL1P1_00857 [Variovorax sp. WDL1]